MESYLVIGGCGFLGANIVDALLKRENVRVAVFDLVERGLPEGVAFYSGDITKKSQVDEAIQRVSLSFWN